MLRLRARSVTVRRRRTVQTGLLAVVFYVAYLCLLCRLSRLLCNLSRFCCAACGIFCVAFCCYLCARELAPEICDRALMLRLSVRQLSVHALPIRDFVVSDHLQPSSAHILCVRVDLMLPMPLHSSWLWRRAAKAFRLRLGEQATAVLVSENIWSRGSRGTKKSCWIMPWFARGCSYLSTNPYLRWMASSASWRWALLRTRALYSC